MASTVKLIFSILLSYPLAGLLKRVPDARPAYKNLFIIRYGGTLYDLLLLPLRPSSHTEAMALTLVIRSTASASST